MNRKLVVFTLGSFVVGAAVMLAFDSPLARIVGMSCLIGFVVAGLFVVITPEFLEPDENDAEGSALARPPRRQSASHREPHAAHRRDRGAADRPGHQPPAEHP